MHRVNLNLIFLFRHLTQLLIVDFDWNAFNGFFSEWLPVRSGVPQGSVIGPLRFSLYIDEIHQVVSNCTIKLFADDIAL